MLSYNRLHKQTDRQTEITAIYNHVYIIVSRAYTGGGQEGESPLELRAILLFKSETEEYKKSVCFFLLVLFEGEIK